MVQKPPLVLLPGMMCDARLFDPQVRALGSDRQVIVPSLGGRSSMGEMARALLAELPFPRFALGGLSMGGILAMAMTAQAPERVERLALIDTNHWADAPERRPVRDRQMADALAGRLRQVIVEEMKPNYLAERSRKDAALLGLLLDMAEKLGPEAFVSQSLALRDRPAYGDVLRGFRRPALVLCGAEDRLCPPERHREMADLCRDAELVIVDGAGHISTLERPDAVNAALASWLDRPARA